MDVNYLGSNIGNKFPDPVFRPSSAWFPKTLAEGFELCQWIYANVPVFRQVTHRLTSFFITDFDFIDTDMATQKSLQDFFNNILDIKQVMQNIGDEWGCYGNAFIRLVVPFTRVLKDPRPQFVQNKYSLNMFKSYEDRISFDLQSLTYSVPDPQNNFNGNITCSFIDTIDKNKANFRLMLIDPRFIRIIYSPVNGESSYIWKFDQDLRSKVQKGILDVINTVPYDMLRALKENKDFKFNAGELFHFRGPLISGLSKDGWGASELLLNFRQIYNMLLYDKADEMLALDYIMPLRVISLDPQALQGSDNGPAQSFDALMYRDQMSSMVANYRKDPTTWQVAPFALQYNEMGGTGKKYANQDLVKFKQDSLLNGAGYPAKFFDMSLDIQILPVSLRLLQTNFWFIYNGFNKLGKWVLSKTQRIFNEKPVKVELQQPKIIDNAEAQAAKANLGANGLLPYNAFLQQYGISDAIAAILQRKKEDAEIEEKVNQLQEDLQKKHDAKANLEAELQSDSQYTGNAPTSVLSKEQEAMQIAQQFLAMPVGPRRVELNKLQQSDFPLYSMVSKYMDKERSDLKSQGAAAMKQQMGYAE